MRQLGLVGDGLLLGLLLVLLAVEQEGERKDDGVPTVYSVVVLLAGLYG